MTRGVNREPKIRVSLACKEFVDACIMRVCVGTNTPQGGDAGHGGRTIIEIDFEGSCAASVSLLVMHGKEVAHYESFDEPFLDKVRIVLYGDAEARNIIRALQFASKVLRIQYEVNKELESGKMTLKEVEVD